MKYFLFFLFLLVPFAYTQVQSSDSLTTQNCTCECCKEHKAGKTCEHCKKGDGHNAGETCEHCKSKCTCTDGKCTCDKDKCACEHCKGEKAGETCQHCKKGDGHNAGETCEHCKSKCTCTDGKCTCDKDKCACEHCKKGDGHNAGETCEHCKKGHSSASGAQAPDGASADSTAPRPILDANLRNELGIVLRAYLTVKNALVADNAKETEEKAKDLERVLNMVGQAKFAVEELDLYIPIAQKMATHTRTLANTQAIKDQRTAFMGLSEAVLALVKAFKINDSALYQQFCPMANNGKGASWLSSEKGIKNPYFGKSMLTCGEVKATFN
ncbi:MAG: DUF3347 domain-containing protein [Rhodothermia bacterium]|nr:DUF3347 domain-containing protein [Rhodothermia bacterium]